MIAAGLSLRVRMPLAGFELDVGLETSARSVGVFGASGAGKTSLLEAVAGWRRPSAGRVRLGGRVLFDSEHRVCVPVRDRGIGYVPQDALLFPHRSVEENIRSGRRRVAESAESPAFEDAVRVLELGPLLGQSATELSGGERQRVALARALCSRPDFLLLDEPLGALDLPLRRRILPYLIRVRAAFDVPMLVVSHDATEIQALCEEAVVLERGRVVANGPAALVLREHATESYENVLAGSVREVREGTATVAVAPGVDVQVPGSRLRRGDRAIFALGADEILLSLAPIEGISARNRLPAVVERLDEVEGSLVARVALGNGENLPLLAVDLTRASADELGIALAPRGHLVFKTQSCRVLSA